MLSGLATVWRGASSSSRIVFHANPTTLTMAAGIGVAVALGAMWLALRRQVRRPARELLAAGAERESRWSARGKRHSRWGAWVAGVCAIAAGALVAWAIAMGGQGADVGAFFGAGALLLIAGIAFSARVLSALVGRGRGELTRPAQLGVRNAARRRGRSLTTVALLACGSFLVVAVGAFRHNPLQRAEEPSSGTGGYALMGALSVPIHRDLNTLDGQKALGLEDADLDGVRFSQLRVREGDDASCLNLNRSQQPTLLGVRPRELRDRHAFTFVKLDGKAPEGGPWLLLSAGGDEDVIPAVGDVATVRWAIGKSVGDTLDYVDDRGRTFQIRIVGMIENSILQGSLLIDEEALQARFGSTGGYRMLLIDAPSHRGAAVSEALLNSTRLQDLGLQLTPTVQRLAHFNQVENAYLSIFQALGGLGLLLGSVGLGMVVLRNVLERRGELALLRAVGFSARSLRRLVVVEHAGLLALGLLCGVVSAGVAVVPALRSPGAGLPFVSLSVTLAAVVVSGLLWTWAAAAWALRGRLLNALRSE